MNQDIYISELVYLGKLSVRAGNTCSNARLSTFSEMMDYYKLNRSFIKIRNCGKLTDEELITFCESQQNNVELVDNQYKLPLVRLVRLENLSNKASNLCMKNNLKELGEILLFYKRFNTFSGLYSCGSKTDEELIKICEKYIESGWWANCPLNPFFQNSTDIQSEQAESEEEDLIILSLEDLRIVEELSVRAYNVLLSNKILSVQNLLDYSDQVSLRNLKNCGKKTEKELLRVVNKYYKKPEQINSRNHNQISNSPESESYSVSEMLVVELMLTKKYKFHAEIIDSHMEMFRQKKLNPFLLCYDFMIKSDYFSDRDSDIVRSILNPSEISNKDVADKYGLSGERIRQLKNKQLKSLNRKTGLPMFFTEFAKYCNITDYQKNQIIFEINQKSVDLLNEELGSNFKIFFVGLVYSIINNDYFSLEAGRKISRPNYVYDYEKYNSYKTVKNHYLIKTQFKNIDFTKLLYFILNQLCNRNDNDIIITKEEVLSKSIKGYRKTKKTCDDKITSLEQERSQSIDSIRNSTVMSLFKIIEGKRSAGIYSEIGIEQIPKGNRITLYELHKLDFHIVNPKNWTYIEETNTKISRLIQLHKSKCRITNNIYTTRRLNIAKSYLGEYSHYHSVISRIVYKEFDIVYSNSYRILRNSTPTIPELIHDILAENGNPMHITDIHKVFTIKHSQLNKSIKSLHGNVLRVKDVITFGRSSTYGLKEWEKNTGIKGGTIRSIVHEFLLDNDSPIHISEIAGYVNKFRDTTPSSILANLKMMQKEVFTYYYGGYVGLKSKNYDKGPSYNISKNQISLVELLEGLFDQS